MQPVLTPALSLVVPVYGNETGIGALIDAITDVSARAGGDFEAVFVVDGSPDRSYAVLRERLPNARFASRLISLSRNFGAFPAIRVGLEHATGRVIAVMAADLQEPPELALEFLETLRDDKADVAFGTRAGRDDPAATRFASRVFWGLYRRFVMPEIPQGGVDIFALTAGFRDRVLALRESHTSLVAQLFWLGGRRVYVPYSRREREHGTSGWTIRKKFRYLSDSIFAFTDLPIRVMFGLGGIALAVASLLAVAVLVARLSGWVEVPGYAATMLTILFFGALNALGLAVVGSYSWRAYENTKGRPLALVQTDERFRCTQP